MKCDDCKNYEPKETGWRGCRVDIDMATYSNDGAAGRDYKSYPRLGWFVKGYKNFQHQTRAAFLTKEEAELFLAALPEEER